MVPSVRLPPSVRFVMIELIVRAMQDVGLILVGLFAVVLVSIGAALLLPVLLLVRVIQLCRI